MPLLPAPAFAKTRHDAAPLAAAAAWLLALLVAMGGSGCEDAFVTEVDVDLPDNERQLVIEAYLRPGDTSFVYVTRTQDINDRGELAVVPGATVTLAVGGEEVARFAERPVDGRSIGSAEEERSVLEYYARVDERFFEAGAALTLTVVAPDGDRATATQPVPGGGELRDVSVRAGDFEGRTTFTIAPEPGAADFLLAGTLTAYSPSVYDSSGRPAAFDTVVSAISFSTGEDFDYVFYGERFRVETAGAAEIASVVDFSASFFGCFGADCPDAPRPILRLRATGVNTLAADYFEALQQIRQTDGNPFVEPVALPSAFEGARGMLVVESRVEEVVVGL